MKILLKGFIFSILFLFVGSRLSAHIVDTVWTKTFEGSEQREGYSVQQTTDGGYIVAGYKYRLGIYLIKTDSMGDTLWTRTFGGSESDNEGAVQQTNDEGYIITGGKSGDVYLLKIDPLGDSLWAKTFGGSGGDQGYSVQQTSDGGYIVTGHTSYSPGAVIYDVYLIKTDSMGDTLWTKTFGGSGDEHGYSVQQTTDGGYIVAGYTSSYGAGSNDVYIIKTDSLGDTLWTKTFGESNNDRGYSVRQTKDGGYIVTGYTTNPFHRIGVYLIKTDSLGNTLWAKTFGGGIGHSVRQTTDGGYIVSGSNTESYYMDVNLIKTDSIGILRWKRTFGREGYDIGYSVQQTTDGGYIMAGNTRPYSGGHTCVYLLKIGIYPGITITSPSGGEEWHADSTYDIIWVSNETSGNVKIEYSLNNGLDWTEITASTPDDGIHPWTIPDTTAYNCLVRISDTDLSMSDISDSAFIIFSDPLIIVKSPNGGELWQAGSNQKISWRSVGMSEDRRIEYSTNNGSDWIIVEENVPDYETYDWITPYTTSDSCLVRISDMSGNIADTSDACFTVSSVYYLTVTFPNGWDIFHQNSFIFITWESAGTSGEVKIEYSINKGSDWITIENSIPDEGSYRWPIPNTPSYNCLVRVADTNGKIADISDELFEILPYAGTPTSEVPEVYALNVKGIAISSQATFRYSLPEKANVVKFSVYNITGSKIKEEIIKESTAGFYSRKINMEGTSKGIYFIRMEVDGGKFTQTKKFLLM